ncbi:MAG: CCA tRNA nucleotidyltransferase [Ilumatobacteraceae bacterium]
MIPQRFAPILEELTPLAERFRQAGFRLFIVGGTVRDLLLGNATDSLDFDFTTNALPQQIKAILDGWADSTWTQGEKFGTIGAQKNGRTLEITTHRAEAYSPDSRKPEVRFAQDIAMDLARRDFTINAMAIELTTDNPELVDPYNGAVDLLSLTLKTPLSPSESFSDDPLRMMRAARFMSSMNMQPVPEITLAVKSMSDRIKIVSAERIRNELDRLIVTDNPSIGLWFLVDTGLAQHFFPELPAMSLEQDPIHRHKDVLTHTFAVVENVKPDASTNFDFRLTRLAALFHDIGKPKTRSIKDGKGVTFHHHEVVGARMSRERLKALRYPSHDVEAITELVALHLRFHTYQMGWTDSAVRRYVRDAGKFLNELNVLTRCDCTTRNEKKAMMLAKRMDELETRIAELATQEELAALRPELDGAAVMEQLGITPGRHVGAALNFLMEIRLEEGLLGDTEVRRRLNEWWATQQKS